MTKIHVIKDESLGEIEREYVEVFAPTIGEVRTRFSPTDIVHINGVRYRMVERIAEIGELILITNADVDGYEVGNVFVTATVFEKTIRIIDNDEEVNHVEHREYRVLELVDPAFHNVGATADDPQSMIDLLANLARRVTSLEAQLKDTQGNVERQAEEIERNTKDIAELEYANLERKSEQTVVINTSNVTVKDNVDIAKIADALYAALERGDCR